MRHLDLFSGIGGFRLAVEAVWPESELVSFVEIDPFCQQWLRANWPGARIHDDIKTFGSGSLADTERNRTQWNKPEDGQRGNLEQNRETTNVDILTGGFPCQPFSVAGKRSGADDNRFLWPQMYRVIQETSPTWIIAENVPGILTIDGGLVFERVCTDLEDEGYEVTPFIIPACAVNAPHRRDRVWIVGHSDKSGLQGHGRLQQRAGERPVGSSGMGNAERMGPTQPQRGIQNEPRRGIDSGQGGMAYAEDSDRWRLSRGKEDTGRRVAKVRGLSRRDDCGFWDDNEYITGHDGKTRRVKPGVCLLANGFPLRNDLLRGFGNAIVPQVAVKIMEAIKRSQQ